MSGGTQPGGVRSHAIGSAVAVVALAVLVVGAFASAAGAAIKTANAHAYRHGIVPMLASGTQSAPAVPAASNADLSYGGGQLGVGVTTGPPRVYVIFWGSQWGAQSTNSHGYLTLAGDRKGMAPDLEAFFTGLGTGGELWSGVMTQYCQGIATGAQVCPANASHVGYPAGGALAGVWADEAAVAPGQATYNQLASEATKAANHFANKTTAANRNVQYFIVSPSGTHPDGFNTLSGNFCAWHSAAGASTDRLAFTNMPYVTDAGASCGVDFVNAGTAGTLDGVTIVGGHEYAETITDQFPPGGWTDNVGNENGDKCAWIRSGQGASQDIALTTGAFAVQSTWANDFNGGGGGCEVSHPIITNGANFVTVTNPGAQTTTVGTAVSLAIKASDSGGATLTYAATGLPAGLQINSASGLITGTPTTPVASSTVVVTATDGTGASGSASFGWTVKAAGNVVTVTTPGAQTTTVGTAVSLAIKASDSGGATLTYGATGLPAGLQINSATGSITGTPTTTGSLSVVVTATDGTGASGSASFGWTINPVSGCTTQQVLGNPGFETGTAAPWTATAGVIAASTAGEPAHSGNWDAHFGGHGVASSDRLQQTRTLPAGCPTVQLTFWIHVDTTENTAAAYDTLAVQVLNSSGGVTTLATYSNLNAATGYRQVTFNLSSSAGTKIWLRFQGTGTNGGGGTTNFVIDDTALNVS